MGTGAHDKSTIDLLQVWTSERLAISSGMGLVGEHCNVVKPTHDVTEHTSIVDIVATQEGLAGGVPVLGLQRKD